MKLLDVFLNGEWLYHNQLFGLATNMNYIRGGRKLMTETMKKYNDMGLTHYTENNFNIFTYINKVNYLPQLIYKFSPYPEDADLFDLISATREVRGQIEQIEPIQRIPLGRAEATLFDRFQHIMDEGTTGKIYLLNLPTAIGKTEMITSSIATIAAPTNTLKVEIAKRMNVICQSTPDAVVFESEYLNRKLQYYYNIGLPKNATAVLYDVINGKGLLKYSEPDIAKAREYLNQLNLSYHTTDTLLTTHTRAIHTPFKHDTIIFDEDPISSLIDIKSLEISDLLKLQLNTGGNKNLEIVIEYLKNLMPGELRETPFLNIDIPELIEKISCLNVTTNIFEFFKSLFILKDAYTPNTIHYVIKRELPLDKKIIIQSATTPVFIYQQLFGDRVELIDIRDVEQQGSIIQYTKRSCSRDGLARYHKDISKAVGNKPVITFKSTQRYFQNPVNEMYFGNCSGYDGMKGKDLVIVGTPHRDNIQYLLTAKVLGIDFKTTDTTMTYQNIEYNGVRFKFNCYDHPALRNIQLSLIESDLIQAVGRARTLRTDAKVEVYSNFPLKLSDGFIY